MGSRCRKVARAAVKIALVAPCPTPFVVGGAQRLHWGWADYVNDHTPHMLELLQLPSPEHDFFSLMSSYECFYKLDLNHFDRVVSSKYPAWMVQHEDHQLYMLHPLRGLYDTYSGSREMNLQDSPFLSTRELLALSEPQHVLSRAEVGGIFDLIHRINIGPKEERALFEFPGYLARRLVHSLDRFAMSSNRIKRFAALSTTVRQRANYFPVSAEVSVIHPPSNLSPKVSNKMLYFLASSRFDAPKRMELIVEAYKGTRTKIPLKLVGTGPTLERCKMLAGDDDRIEFLGFVSDSELLTLYANAVAVIFVPQDEDYGLITVEAFLAERPVITATDSGGPCELVQDKVNGWIVQPTRPSLSDAISEAGNDIERSRAMGVRGKACAKSICWDAMGEWTTRSNQ